MAYKFQLGNFTASGSITAESGLNANAAGVSSVGALAGVTTVSGSGKFEMGSLAVGGTDVTATAANLNQLAGVTLGDVVTQNSSSFTVTDLTASALAISDVSGIAGDALEDDGAGLLRVATGGITNTMLSGGIDFSKLATLNQANILIGNGSNVATAQTVSGDVSIDKDGVVAIGSGKVTNAMLSGSISADKLNLNANQFSNAGGVLGLKSSISGALTFENNITISGDLIVTGTTFSASVGTLLIEDALINIGDGQATFADDYGIEFGTSGSSWASLKTDSDAGFNNLSSSLPLLAPALATNDWTIDSTHISGNLPVSASAFYGDGSNLQNIAAGNVKLGGGINLVTGTATATNKLTLADTGAGAFTLTMPEVTSANAGTLYVVKDKAGFCGVSGKALTVAAFSGQTIDGAASIVLESNYAAVNLFAVFLNSTGSWAIV